MSRRNPTFFPAQHTIKEFEPYGIAGVKVEGRWVTIATDSAYDKDNNLMTRGLRVKIKAF